MACTCRRCRRLLVLHCCRSQGTCFHLEPLHVLSTEVAFLCCVSVVHGGCLCLLSAERICAVPYRTGSCSDNWQTSLAVCCAVFQVRVQPRVGLDCYQVLLGGFAQFSTAGKIAGEMQVSLRIIQVPTRQPHQGANSESTQIPDEIQNALNLYI